MADAQAPAEVEAVPAAEHGDAKWPYEAKDDGEPCRICRSAPRRRQARADARPAPRFSAIWKTHDALRADLTDLLKAIDAMATAEASEEPRAKRVRAQLLERARRSSGAAPLRHPVATVPRCCPCRDRLRGCASTRSVPY